MFQKVKGVAARCGTAIVAVSAAPVAMAQTAYDPLVTSVDWSDVQTALLAVGGAIIAIFVVFKGIKLVTRAVKGA